MIFELGEKVEMVFQLQEFGHDMYHHHHIAARLAAMTVRTTFHASTIVILSLRGMTVKLEG